MKVLSGKSVYAGIAMGPVVILKRREQRLKQRQISDPEEEIGRLTAAIMQSQSQLRELYETALHEVGESNAMIFMAHQMILEDESYLDAVYNVIRTEMVNAEHAVSVTGSQFAELFASMDDDYMRERAADIQDVSNRLIGNLTGSVDMEQHLSEASVILADDLTPSETMKLDKSKILAFVTTQGSANSHTAILARTMNIPALVGVAMDFSEIRNGMTAIVDGFSETMILDPTESVIAETASKIQAEEEKRNLLFALKGKENVTMDGSQIDIFANIGSMDDISAVQENDAGGIGLFRSEFLYLGCDTFPTEEEQFQAYKQVLQSMGDKKVIIRTLDIGADKQADYFELEKEDNPALGYRAIRICLKQPEIFRTQLRALFRAAVYGNLSVMYPMIISTEEVKQIAKIVNEVKAELEKAEIPFRIPEQGIMIETPAAVMISDELAEMVDFFSIGTNDLTQYTLAIDRQNRKLDEFYNPYHKAILRMIKMVVDHAHKAGKWVGICGELGSDLSMTEEFVRMGIDELSVAPSMVLKLRKKVREIKI